MDSAVLTSIPLPESNHRYGDLVLNDGAPVGYRIRDGQEAPVFNELELLTSSEEQDDRLNGGGLFAKRNAGD